MSATPREKTAYQRREDGDDDTLEVQRKISWIRAARLMLWLRIRGFFAISLIIVLVVLSVSPQRTLEITALVVMIAAVALIYGSIISGHQLVVPDMLVVQGTGALEDMRDAKNRAFNMIGPAIGLPIGGVIYLLSQVINFSPIL